MCASHDYLTTVTRSCILNDIGWHAELVTAVGSIYGNCAMMALAPGVLSGVVVRLSLVTT